MSSLSVYKGINDRSASRAFMELLRASSKEPEEFAAAWGAFFSLLSSRGYADSFLRCMTKAALYDENAFSRACAAGCSASLPQEVITAARRDLRAIITIGSITPEILLQEYPRREELSDIEDTLPRWKTGRAVAELEGEDPLTELDGYYRKNGCGAFARYRAFIWRNKELQPVQFPDQIQLSSLTGYEIPRSKIYNNTAAFLHGAQCNNALLYGDRGTGKSSTVKAMLNEFCSEGLRMVELPKDKLGEFPLLVERLAPVPMKFIIFIDDLSFSEDDKSYAWLKAVLEGGLSVRPDNTLIYATSNRRHLIKESFSDREGSEIHRNDSIQETLSLSDRFGLSVLFGKPDKQEYLDIVLSLAFARGIAIDEDKLISRAEAFAVSRGGRSPRCARQFISSLEAELCLGESSRTKSHADTAE